MAAGEHQESMVRAGEYVLGTLTAEERQRFEIELQESAEARREVANWERRLGGLGLALAPVEPPADVWPGIRSAIETDDKTASATARQNVPPPATERTGLWRGLAIAASAAALVLAAMLFVGSSPRNEPANDQPAYASVIVDQPTGMSWLVTAHTGTHEMQVVAMGDYQVPDGKTLRAWLKPENGEPIPLGEWPHQDGQHVMTVSDDAAKSMDQPAQLMVSMEDSRANNEQPRGRVMWTSPIARHTG